MEYCAGGSITDLSKVMLGVKKRLPETVIAFVLHEVRDVASREAGGRD